MEISLHYLDVYMLWGSIVTLGYHLLWIVRLPVCPSCTTIARWIREVIMVSRIGFHPTLLRSTISDLLLLNRLFIIRHLFLTWSSVYTFIKIYQAFSNTSFRHKVLQAVLWAFSRLSLHCWPISGFLLCYPPLSCTALDNPICKTTGPVASKVGLRKHDFWLTVKSFFGVPYRTIANH